MSNANAAEAPRLPTRFGGCLHAEVEHRPDGSTWLRSTEPLQPHPERLTEVLARQADATPDRLFVARRSPPPTPGAPRGDWEGITYGRMRERARAIGQWLVDQGASAERPVAILSENGLEHLSLAFGALWAGVPVVPVSPAYSLVSQDFGKLRHVLRTTTPRVVFATGAAYARAIAATVGDGVVIVLADEAMAAAQAGALAGRNIVPWSALLATAPGPALDAAHAAVGPDTIVKFLFTSGSTKEPKAVVNTHRMLCANQQMLRQTMAFMADEPPVLVDWLPWNHTFGGNHNIGIALWNGGTLYIDDGRPTPAGMAETLRNLREISPTVYFNVPRGFEELAVAMGEDAVLRERLFSRVQVFMYAGAGLSQPVWNRLDELAVATLGRRVPIITGLGMTETAPSCLFAVGEGVRSGHVGLPCPGVEVKLVPVEDKTEVRFRGPNVMPGYWRAPQQTGEAFDEDGFYRTGDAVRWVDPADPQQGLAFDGRIAEDFKLSSGTFVRVGPLRAAAIAAGDPLVQDVVVAGLDRDDIGLMVLPRLDEARKRAGLPADATPAQVLGSAPVLAFFQDLLDRLWSAGTGSATRPARLLLLTEPPEIDRGEVTDKGSINQRAVLAHRGHLVAHLYGEPLPPGTETAALPPVLRPRRG